MLRQLIIAQKNCILILPYVSLVQEKICELAILAAEIDFHVQEYAAGSGELPPEQKIHKQSIYVATVEKGLALVNSLLEMKRLHEIGLVVVDELHFLGEIDRGPTLECLLTKLLTTKGKIKPYQ